MAIGTRPTLLSRGTGAVLRFPLVRIVLAIAMVMATALGAQALASRVHLRSNDAFTWATGVPHAMGATLVTAAALAGYALFVWVFERRRADEISMRTMPRWVVPGVLLGVALVSTSIGLLWLLGVYRIEAVADSTAWGGIAARSAVSAMVTASFEEILLRAIVFRIVEMSLGSWPALAISAVLFGLAHVGNPNATMSTTIGLSIQAGVLLGAAYMLAGNLWLAIGLHAGWNFMQQAVFGGALSGSEVHAALTARFVGPTWLAGGGFGVEGSIVATLVCSIASAAMLWYCVQNGKIKPGFWKHESARPTLVPA